MSGSTHPSGSTGTIFGDSIGQTFFAPETLLTGLTVWRPPNNRSVIGAKLFITAVDTTESPPRPVTSSILREGPMVTVYDSDPPGQLIEMRFVLDPPVVLPRRGLYAFFLQPEDCWTGQAWLITVNDANPYPDGIYWVTGRTAFLPCHLADVHGGDEAWDLLFKLEYCRATTTSVRRGGWGELKVKYR